MIRVETFDPEVCEVVQDALNALTLRFPLASFSILGDAVIVASRDDIHTMCTNGRYIWVAPSWVQAKGQDDIMFDLLHEWFHIFYNHVRRRGDRDPQVWNTAADIIVVSECVTTLTTPSEVFKVPEDGVQIPPWYSKTMTVEDVYDRLIDEQKKAPPPPTPEPESGEQGQGEPGPGEPDPGAAPLRAEGDLRFDEVNETEEQADAFQVKFSAELAAAALLMTNMGRPLPDHIRERVVAVTQGRIPWASLLRGDLLGALGHDAPTWAHPNKRYFPIVTLPTLRATQERVLILLVDVSASVGKTLLELFAANVSPAAARASKTYIITFDAVVREILEVRNPRDALRDLKFATGHHTHTSAVQAFAEGQKRKGTAYACLTDGHIYLPATPIHNTLFAVPRGGGTLPWGKHYIMDYSW